MLEGVLIFLIVSMVSALGSLQLGLVNSEVICTVLNNEKKAKHAAFGGVLPEIIYAGLAIYLFDLISGLSDVYEGVFVITTNVLVILIALAFFTRKASNLSKEKVNRSRGKRMYIREKFFENIGPFTKGFILGMVNLQLIFFWFLVYVYMSMYLPVEMHVVPFVLGAPVGALISLLVFIKLVSKFREKYEEVISVRAIFKLTGTILILVAIYQICNYLFN